MSAGRALLFSALVAIALVAIAAWLLNVPVVVVGVGVVISLVVLFLWLSRHGGAGKRSGAGAPDQNSRVQ